MINMKTNRIVIIIALTLLITLSCKLVSLGSRDDDIDTPVTSEATEVEVAEDVSAEEVLPTVETGQIISSGKIEVFIPPGLHDQQPAITTKVVNEPLPPAPEKSTAIGQAYEITSKKELAGPVLISISYDPAELSPGVSEENLYIATLVGGEWQVVPDGFVDTENHTVNVSVEHFSYFGIFESAAESIYDAVQTAVGDEISSEYFSDLPDQIRYDFYDLEIKPQDVTAVVHAKLSLATKTASGVISFGNLVSKTAGLAIGAIEDGVEGLAWAMGELIFAEVGDYATDSQAGSFIVAAYDSFDLGRDIGSYIVDLKDANPAQLAAKASAWILAREMEYINENMDPAFKDLWKFNTLSGSRLDVYAVYFDTVSWKDKPGMGTSGVKFYYYDESLEHWINYHDDVFVWKMTFEPNQENEVTVAEADEGDSSASTVQEPTSTTAPTKAPIPSETIAPSATVSRPTSGQIFISPDGTGDYPTIKEAVDAVESGTIIYLDSGTYYIDDFWGLEIDKSLSIIGTREDLTELIFTNDDGIDFEGPGTLVLEGMSIFTDSFAIFVEDGEIIIRNCRVFSGSNAVVGLEGNSTGSIQASEITSTEGWWECIDLRDHAYLDIEDSFIDGCGYGIYFTDNSSGTVRNNTVQRNDVGIFVKTDAQVTIENNFLTDNNNDGIFVTDSASATIRGNDCSRNGSSGIDVGLSANATIENNICNDNGIWGIHLWYESSGYVDGNECAWNGEYGIENGSENFTLGTNNCYDNGIEDIDNWGNE